MAEWLFWREIFGIKFELKNKCVLGRRFADIFSLLFEGDNQKGRRLKKEQLFAISALKTNGKNKMYQKLFYLENELKDFSR